MGDAWDPDQYHRFRADRARPFHDLLALLQPAERPRVVDLGCGTGELTVALHRATGARATIGIDRSPAMLERARQHEGEDLRFVEDDIATFGDTPAAAGFDTPAAAGFDTPAAAGFDIVFANASMQWVPDHPAVLRRWASALGDGGQLAVQVPANADHASHRVAQEVASSAPFAALFPGGAPPPDPVTSVLPPETYAEILDELGFVEQHVRLQVYGATLGSSADIVEWVKGTNLTRFQRLLPAEAYATFVDRYRTRLLHVVGERSPYFYAFKRILLWGRR